MHSLDNVDVELHFGALNKSPHLLLHFLKLTMKYSVPRTTFLVFVNQFGPSPQQLDTPMPLIHLLPSISVLLCLILLLEDRFTLQDSPRGVPVITAVKRTDELSDSMLWGAWMILYSHCGRD